MKIGYPCINRTLPCTGAKTFRLKSYSPERLISTVDNNIDCLKQMLAYNVTQSLLFFRISSDLVPFASHPICTFDWQSYFKDTLHHIGRFIQQHHIRISMHPDQFIVLNSPHTHVIQRSIAELVYHAELLDLMNLDKSAKIQLHVGGMYNNKTAAQQRFIKHYTNLPDTVHRRLVIENDDKLYTLKDCHQIHRECGIPVLYDTFHHTIHNNGETIPEAFAISTTTWKTHDGIPMIDYSSQDQNKRIGAHADHINAEHFTDFLQQSQLYNFDVMLEIKDKEKSAIRALELAKNDPRLFVLKVDT